jgi:hypothetical protein
MAWFTEYGWEVYTGFGTTSCDFVAMRVNVVRRVEVKTTTPGPNGLHTTSGVKHHLHDWLVCVTADGRVLRDQLEVVPSLRHKFAPVAAIEGYKI